MYNIKITRKYFVILAFPIGILIKGCLLGIKHIQINVVFAIYFSGIFIISEEEVFDEPSLFSKLKMILNHVYKSLNTNPHMYGNCPNTNDRLVLHMSTSTKVLKCKSVDVGTSKYAITPVEWKFLPKSQQWQRLDCYYEFDEVYPVVVKKSGISVKQQFQVFFCCICNINVIIKA